MNNEIRNCRFTTIVPGGRLRIPEHRSQSKTAQQHFRPRNYSWHQPVSTVAFSSGAKIYNNVFTGISGWAISNISNFAGTEFKNNIIYNCSNGIWGGASGSHTNNMLYGVGWAFTAYHPGLD